MFTAKEVSDKIAIRTEEVLRETPNSTEHQAKRIAHMMVLCEYEAERRWLREFQFKYKELLDKVRYSDKVVESLRKDYQKKKKRLLKIDRFVFYLENTTYTHHA